MKVNFIDSVIKFLPAFDGDNAHRGGHNFEMHIQWYKTNKKGFFIGLTTEEAEELLNLLNTTFKENVKDSVIKEIEDTDLPFIPFSMHRYKILEYQLSKISAYSQIIDFEVLGYLPS